MNDILNNLGLFTKEESNDYLKHMITIQTIAKETRFTIINLRNSKPKSFFLETKTKYFAKL